MVRNQKRTSRGPLTDAAMQHRDCDCSRSASRIDLKFDVISFACQRMTVCALPTCGAEQATHEEQT